MASEPMASQPDLFRSGQIKLFELSVYNWGSFHGLHTARIDPVGTLITGDNGAGKSTLVDGLMALLLPAGKASFNIAAAQGDRTDRTLISYIRGNYGTAHDGSRIQTLHKRKGAVVTGLRAYYRAEDGSEISLAALFWMTQATNALVDLKRIYLVAKRNLTLEELLDAFGEGNARALKQVLRNDPRIIACDDRFNEYQETYCRLLCMDNRNAPALLSRALGLKKIDDLTTLIRDLVLEPSTVREDARRAVAEFGDLVGIHEQLLDARCQRDALVNLPSAEQTLNKAQLELQKLNSEQDGLPVYFGEQCHRLWSQRIKELEQRLAQVEILLKRTEKEERDATERTEQRHADYLRAGGDRVDSVKQNLVHTKDRLTQINQTARQYQQIVREVGLDPRLDEQVFDANRNKVQASQDDIQQEKEQAQNQFADMAAKLTTAQDQQKNLLQAIKQIEARPDSNIDLKFQRLRDEMIEVLAIDRDQLRFIGELADVQEQHRAWQGAIERALGGLRNTLIVPESGFPLVTRWLNQRHTGLHVRVQVAYQTKVHVEFKTDGYLRKLQWRKHPYRQWLKQHLARFDLQCVQDTQALDNTPFSMTRQGLMHLAKGRFEKKDQHRIEDRRHWQLGFSNKARLSLLRQDASLLEKETGEHQTAVVTARQALDGVERRARLWDKLAEYQWQDIDVPYWQNRMQRYEDDLRALQQAGGDLAVAQDRWQQAKTELQRIAQNKAEQNQTMGSIKTDLQSAQEAQGKSLQAANEGLIDKLRQALVKRVGELADSDLPLVRDIENKHRQDIEKSRASAGKRKEKAGNQAVSIMSAFYGKWEHIAVDWGRAIDSLEDYIKHLNQLQQEGLPALVEQFKERLNRHTTQSLARIRSRMDSEREDISERIDTINKVLARTEFRQGTYLKLGIKPEQYEHVNHFNKQLMRVLSEAGSEDHEARFNHLRAVIEILDKASSTTSANTLESLRLLDPRHQLSFYAEEIEAQTNIVRDVLMSSSGKSGGEKESFAGTIVAASLAYVLTPDGSDKPIYSTVFLDEAFSNTAEAVSRRVLRVFRELHIHVNLITPFKNLSLARESARSLLIAERDSHAHESRLCEVTWEEIDRRLQQQDSERLMAEADELGVELS